MIPTTMHCQPINACHGCRENRNWLIANLVGSEFRGKPEQSLSFRGPDGHVARGFFPPPDLASHSCPSVDKVEIMEFAFTDLVNICMPCWIESAVGLGGHFMPLAVENRARAFISTACRSCSHPFSHHDIRDLVEFYSGASCHLGEETFTVILWFAFVPDTSVEQRQSQRCPCAQVGNRCIHLCWIERIEEGWAT